MINSYISQQIERNFPYKPTDDQFLALHTLTEFLLSEEPDSLLLMKGYAGTGKTSLVGALVKTLNELKQKRFCWLQPDEQLKFSRATLAKKRIQFIKKYIVNGRFPMSRRASCRQIIYIKIHFLSSTRLL